MKAARKLFVLLLVMCSIGALATPVNALVSMEKSADTGKGKAALSIDISGLASCSADVRGDSMSHKIDIILALYHVNGSTATLVKSWALEGKYRISETKTCYVSKGYDYQLIASITITDGSGKIVDSFEAKSLIVHY